MASKSMAPEGPSRPHLVRGSGGLAGEISDLRGDVDSAMERGELFTAKVSINAPEIKTLAASPVELAAAEGAGTMLEFVSLALRLVSGSEVLTEAGDNLGVKYTDASGVQVSETIETTGFIDAVSNSRTNGRAANDTIVAGDAAINAPLVLDNLNAEIGGNASDDAVLECYVSYKVHRNVG